MPTVVTNNKPRKYIVWDQLTPQDQQEFSYLDSRHQKESAMFFRYRGAVYDIGEATAPSVGTALEDWHGLYHNTFDSGVVFKWTQDDEIIVGHFY